MFSKKQIIIFSIVFFIIGMSVGFAAGVGYAANMCLEKGVKFLTTHGVEIKINKEVLLNFFQKYN